MIPHNLARFASPSPQRVGRPEEASHSECGDFCSGPGARDGIHMKNTGKRIFFSVLAFALANVAVVTAGALSSSR